MGLFTKHKDYDENNQTNEIKKATISDTITNSISNTPVQTSQNTIDSEFVNPFAPPMPPAPTEPISTVPLQGNSFTNENHINNSFSGYQNPRDEMMAKIESPKKDNNLDILGAPVPNQNFQDSNIQNIANSVKNNMDYEKIQEMIDETVEKIIEEKWNSIEGNINKVLRWKEAKDTEINMLKEDIVSIADNFNKLEMKLINKISNYDKNILDVNSEIKALEKVFQKVTPTLINNVNELSKIADEFREAKEKKERKDSVDE